MKRKGEITSKGKGMESKEESRPLTTVLIDDEQDSLEALEILLNVNCPELDVVALCPGSQEGLAAIRAYRPDLIFLDIEMPVMNGFEMLEQLDQIEFDIIFVTAYD